VLVVVVVGVAAIAACSFRVHQYKSGFSKVKAGDTEAEVISRLGKPSFRERTGATYLRYATAGCNAPCAERLWWERPIVPGIEAWSVELGRDRRVLRTYHWLSP
jgi:hypothetical protein